MMKTPARHYDGEVVMSDTDYPPLVNVNIRVCQACIDAVGQECHTPGCFYWLHDVPNPEGLQVMYLRDGRQQ